MLGIFVGCESLAYSDSMCVRGVDAFIDDSGMVVAGWGVVSAAAWDGAADVGAKDRLMMHMMQKNCILFQTCISWRSFFRGFDPFSITRR